MIVKPETVEQYLEDGCGRCEFGGTPQCKVMTWPEELRLLRELVQSSGLIEEIKWGAPCYTQQGKNILMLSALKDSVVVSFFRGAELPDPDGILEEPGENSRFARYIRFIDVQTVASHKSKLLGFIQQAIKLEESGKRPEPTDPALDHPQELTQAFATNPQLAQAFAALTPGRQRGYLIHFSSAKQSKTRAARIEKCLPKIFCGKGWNER